MSSSDNASFLLAASYRIILKFWDLNGSIALNGLFAVHMCSWAATIIRSVELDNLPQSEINGS